MSERERAGIQSVEVGVALLQVLGEAEGPLMRRDLAREAGMSAAKAHRYLVSFQRLQLVAQDAATTRYDLGPAALKLGLASLERLDAVKLARQRVAQLMEEVGHTLALAVWGNHGPTIVHWEESPSAVTVNLRLGDVMPLLSSATGQCFAAHAPKEAIASMLKEEMARAQKQGRTDVPTTLAEVRALLDAVRQRGAARVVDTLLPGIVGFCARRGVTVGLTALGVVTLGPTGTFDGAWGGAVDGPLRAMARQLSRDLGWRGDE
jgi:DNA-binding IclR family transcriptional regulator